MRGVAMFVLGAIYSAMGGALASFIVSVNALPWLGLEVPVALVGGCILGWLFAEVEIG